MSRVPIRLRLTLFFTAAMAVVLAGAAWLLYLQVGSDLGSGIDQSLRSRAQDLGALVRDGGSLRSTSSPLIESGESFAELLSPGGRVLDASASLHRTPLLSADELRRARAHALWLNRPSAPGLDEPTRLLAVRVAARRARRRRHTGEPGGDPRRPAPGVLRRRPGRAAARGARRLSAGGRGAAPDGGDAASRAGDLDVVPRRATARAGDRRRGRPPGGDAQPDARADRGRPGTRAPLRLGRESRAADAARAVEDGARARPARRPLAGAAPRGDRVRGRRDRPAREDRGRPAAAGPLGARAPPASARAARLR